jgi:hypothetical protein
VHLGVSLLFAPSVVPAQGSRRAPPARELAPRDSVTRREVVPGIVHTTIEREQGPWRVSVLAIDLRHREIGLRHLRAHDSLRTRDRPSEMFTRLSATGADVVAVVNADFFDLKTGENENNQVIDGEWWKGVKVTDSPFDTFRDAHAQFAFDSLRRPAIDRFEFFGEARTPRGAIPLVAGAAGEEGTISRNAEVRHPRTGVGFSRDSGTLFLVTVDGRSTSSVGMTLVEFADLMRELGAWQGMNFDGGGSTTMVVQGRIVNVPSDPTGERRWGMHWL